MKISRIECKVTYLMQAAIGFPSGCDIDPETSLMTEKRGFFKAKL